MRQRSSSRELKKEAIRARSSRERHRMTRNVLPTFAVRLRLPAGQLDRWTYWGI
jgi:hypothetical protein